MSTTSPTDAPGRLRSVKVARHLDAPPDRLYRAWADPEEIVRWFPNRIEGSLAVGARSVLVWEREQAWVDVVAAEPNRRFVYRWHRSGDESLITTVTITITPEGYGSRFELEDGPFDIDRPAALDAYAEALLGWGEVIAQLRAHLDFSVDIRQRAR